MAVPVFTEDMNRRRHDRGSRDNESTDQTNVAGHLFWQYRKKGAFGRAERQQDERGEKQALSKHDPQ